MTTPNPQAEQQMTRMTDQEAIRQYTRAIKRNDRDAAKALWREHSGLWQVFMKISHRHNVYFLPEMHAPAQVYIGGKPT